MTFNVSRQATGGMAPPGFRLPAGTRVGGVHLQVTDLQRSLDYYRDVLGLAVLDRTDRSASLGAAGSTEPIVSLEATARRSARRGALGLYHFAVRLPDRAALGRFAAHLVRTDARAGMADHLVSEAIYLSDPDGLGIEVYADRPRDTWRYQGQELVMATDPLDLERLIAEGGERAWDGAPAGTTMGHVHLHVGSLEQADAYYRAGLGFDLTVWSYPGALFFAADGYHHHLGTNTWSPGLTSADDQARLLEWDVIVPQPAVAAAAAASLIDAGYQADDTGRGWTSADPWGTRVRIRAE